MTCRRRSTRPPSSRGLMDEAAVNGAEGVSAGRSGGANARAASNEQGLRGHAKCAWQAQQPFGTDGEQHLGGRVRAARMALDARRIRSVRRSHARLATVSAASSLGGPSLAELVHTSSEAAVGEGARRLLHSSRTGRLPLRSCSSSAARARVTPVSRPRVHPKARAQARSPCSPSATYESSGNSENGDRRCGLPRAGGSGWPRATTTPTVVRRPQSRTASRSLPPPGGRTPARAAQLTRSPGRLPPRTCARSPRA